MVDQRSEARTVGCTLRGARCIREKVRAFASANRVGKEHKIVKLGIHSGMFQPSCVKGPLGLELESLVPDRILCSFTLALCRGKNTNF
jgi:hypothetical protein